MEQTVNKKGLIMFALIFIGFAVLIIGIKSKENKEKEQFKKEAIRVLATVDRVSSHTTTQKTKTSSGKTKRKTVTTYTAYVSYEIDGMEYNNVQVTGTSSTRQGSSMTVYCDPDAPNIAKSEADLRTYSIGSWFFFFAIGGVMVWAAVTGKLKNVRIQS